MTHIYCTQNVWMHPKAVWMIAFSEHIYIDAHFLHLITDPSPKTINGYHGFQLFEKEGAATSSQPFNFMMSKNGMQMEAEEKEEKEEENKEAPESWR